MACFDGRRPKVMSQRNKMLEDFEPWPEVKMVKHWLPPRVVYMTPYNGVIYATGEEKKNDVLEEIRIRHPLIEVKDIWIVDLPIMALFRPESDYSTPAPFWSVDFEVEVIPQSPPGQCSPPKTTQVSKDESTDENSACSIEQKETAKANKAVQ